MKTSLSPEVKRLILDKVSSGRYRSADEVVRRGLILLQKDEEMGTPNSAAKSDLSTIFTDIAASVPDADWRTVPADLSKSLDHYLYDAHKTS